jgi:hypothetical protein
MFIHDPGARSVSRFHVSEGVKKSASVMLSEAKHLCSSFEAGTTAEILRFAQDDS